MANEHLPQEQPIRGPGDESSFHRKPPRPTPRRKENGLGGDVSSDRRDPPGKVPTEPRSRPETGEIVNDYADGANANMDRPPVRTEAKPLSETQKPSQFETLCVVFVFLLISALAISVFTTMSYFDHPSDEPHSNPVEPAGNPYAPSGDPEVEAVVQEFATYGAIITRNADGQVDYLDLSKAEPLESYRMIQMHADHLAQVRRLRCPREWEDGFKTRDCVYKLPSLKTIELHHLSGDLRSTLLNGNLRRREIERYEYADAPLNTSQ